jgi:MFS family permease
MGSGVAILIGGGVLHAVDMGVLAGTPLAGQAPWRLVLLLIGLPGLAWSLVILVIREPARQTGGTEPPPLSAAVSASAARFAAWAKVAPVYVVVAAASLVDNAVGAWAPSLLIRNFARDPGRIGIELGLLLTVGFGGGVLVGGLLADRAGSFPRKLAVCLTSACLILPASLLMNSGHFAIVLVSVPLYFALSGVVTAVGFSSILDIVPNRSRGLAMSISFFLNVAIGAGLGPTAVALAGDHIFGASAGLGPAISSTVIGGYLIAVISILLMLHRLRRERAMLQIGADSA